METLDTSLILRWVHKIRAYLRGQLQHKRTVFQYIAVMFLQRSVLTPVVLHPGFCTNYKLLVFSISYACVLHSVPSVKYTF